MLLNTSLPTVTFEQVFGGGHCRVMARVQAEEQHVTETDYIKLTFRFRRLAHSLARSPVFLATRSSQRCLSEQERSDDSG